MLPAEQEFKHELAKISSKNFVSFAIHLNSLEELI